MQIHIRVEGTAAEVSDILQTLPMAASAGITAVEMTNVPTQPTEDLANSKADPRFVTTEFARRALKRRPLSDEMKAMLKELFEAHPKLLSQKTLLAIAGYDRPSRLAGAMGAFGRRLANTEGYDPDAQFFEYGWEDGLRTYRLPASVREALSLEKLV